MNLKKDKIVAIIPCFKVKNKINSVINTAAEISLLFNSDT